MPLRPLNPIWRGRRHQSWSGSAGDSALAFPSVLRPACSLPVQPRLRAGRVWLPQGGSPPPVSVARPLLVSSPRRPVAGRVLAPSS